MEDLDEVLSLIVLCNTPKIGGKTAKTLIRYFGSAKAVLKASNTTLQKIDGIGGTLASNITRREGYRAAEKTLKQCAAQQIQILPFTSPLFPKKLLQIPDSPLILYSKGNVELNYHQFIGIVGTRKPTKYGKLNCEKLVSDLSNNDIVSVSGLAYGIDVCVHKSSIENNIPTIGVLGHGHNFIYPSSHQHIAEKMLENGALISEFPPDQAAERNNFPARNRIIAGLSDAIIVVESGSSGGSMITAEFANQYNREVFAFPGRANDRFSKGCNHLIKKHKAHLIESAEDLNFMLNINLKNTNEKQLELFAKLDSPERKIVETIQQHGTCLIDRLICTTNIGIGKLSAYLISLECKGIVTCLPGKRYILV